MFLYQHITEYTHYRKGQNPRLLDLILTNEEGMVNDMQYVPPLGKSDHVCVIFNKYIYIHIMEKRVDQDLFITRESTKNG